MDCRANSDLFFLPDEKFDFDVSLSPASSKGDEDEDEVFVGPVRHRERCVSVGVDSLDGCGEMRVSWTPLTGDQLEAVCEEAHKLASQLQNSERSQSQSEDGKTSDATTEREEFVQDAEAKLGVLAQTATALSPIKRQTFIVQESPMKELPPVIQQRLLSGRSINARSSTHSLNASSSTRHASANTNAFARPAASTRLSTSSPMAGPKSQPRTGLRGKATLSVAAVLPSKPAAPKTSCSASKSKVEKTRLQPPTKAAGSWRRSPASRLSNRAESCEDLLSDSASVASDISDSSLNSSLLGKRPLAPPTKGAVRNLSGVKAPTLQSRRMTERKNTSSSSSSMSSFNSSISLSPAKGKLNSSLSGSTGPAPSSISRPVNQTRLRRFTVNSTAEQPSSAASRRSLSTQVRKPHELERLKALRTTPLKRAEATPLQTTPAKKVMERAVTMNSTASPRRQSGLKMKSKPEVLVLPTPGRGVGGLSHGDDVSKMLKPKRQTSASNVDRPAQKPPADPPTPSSSSSRSQQAKARRPSAIPTPVKRRMSSIPVATPTNQSRLVRPQPSSDPDIAPCSAVAVRERSCSPAPTDTKEVESADVPDIQPFNLEEEVEEEVEVEEEAEVEEEVEVEEEEPPAALPSYCLLSPQEEDQTENMDPGEGSRGETEPSRNVETAKESSKTQEVLLLDLPPPALQPQEKLLIDLTNTPSLIRTISKTCGTNQLIDLSSPLIKWSPEDKRENNAPLINLSF